MSGVMKWKGAASRRQLGFFLLSACPTGREVAECAQEAGAPGAVHGHRGDMHERKKRRSYIWPPLTVPPPRFFFAPPLAPLASTLLSIGLSAASPKVVPLRVALRAEIRDGFNEPPTASSSPARLYPPGFLLLCAQARQDDDEVSLVAARTPWPTAACETPSNRRAAKTGKGGA